MTRRFLRKYALHLGAIFGLMLIAGVVGGYILVNQRLKFPWEDRYSVRIALSTAQALTPGQGQEVTVAGVQVGEVGEVRLREGRAEVELDIERDRLASVHVDARALVRPKTGLQDMTIDLDPGDRRKPRLDEDDVLPVERSMPQVNVEEVLAGLDADTRGYVQSLLQGLGEGLGGQAKISLRQLLERLQPTLARTSTLTEALRSRRTELRRLVAGLSRLSGRVAVQGDDLARLVSASNATFGAVAAEDDAVRRTVRDLPATLKEIDGALSAASPLARELAPTARALLPAVGELRGALTALPKLSSAGRPAVAQLSGLSQEAVPPARQLRRALDGLAPAVPDLTRAVGVLRYVTNELAHNPEGKEEGYLFWLSWFAHNANSMLSTQDANAGQWRGQLVFSCANLSVGSLLVPALAPAAAAGVCPK